MLNVLEDRSVSTSGISAAKTFSFAPSAKAFKVFIDGIYSDKIRAVIRELWTNAYDAHVLAGKRDEPFKCTLPTLLNPELIVRDFGPSMDHETMMTNFTQAFLSSKDNSNDFVGSLGLGRLSAFAYTDSFNVNTYIDGVKRDYVVFINSDGIPELAMLSMTATDEPTGFEVRFPVKVNDCTAFWNAAKFTAVGFDVAPSFSNEDVKFYQKKISGTGWASYQGLDGAYARQGCVIYPLDPRVIQEIGNYRFILDMTGVVIDFPIGSIDYNASRESLGYNERTRKSLEVAFDGMKKSLLDDAQASISQCATWHQAAITLASLRSAGLHRDILNQVLFNGKDLNESVSVRNSTFKKYNVALFRQDIKHGKSSFHMRYEDSVSFYARSDAPVYAVRDGLQCVSPRIQHHASTLDTYAAYIVVYKDARGLERMKRILGYPKMIDVASLPKPPTRKRTANRASDGMVNAYNVTSSSVYRTEVDVSDAHYYVLVDRGSVDSMHSYLYNSVINFLEKNGHTDFKNVVGITRSQEAKFVKAGWKLVIPELKKAVAQLVDTPENRRQMYYASVQRHHLLLRGMEDVEVENVCRVLGAHHPLVKIVAEAAEIDKLIASPQHGFQNMADFANVKMTPDVDPRIDENEARKKDFLEKYPMVKLMRESLEGYFNGSSYISEESQKILLDYLSEKEYDVEQALAA